MSRAQSPNASGATVYRNEKRQSVTSSSSMVVVRPFVRTKTNHNYHHQRCEFEKINYENVQSHKRVRRRSIRMSVAVVERPRHCFRVCCCTLFQKLFKPDSDSVCCSVDCFLPTRACFLKMTMTCLQKSTMSMAARTARAHRMQNKMRAYAASLCLAPKKQIMNARVQTNLKFTNISQKGLVQ